MKLNPEDYLTVEQAGAAIGGNRRAAYRAVARARQAGKDVTTVIFGRTLVHKSKLAVLKEFYFPYYSEAHQKMVKKWGAAGGRQSGITKRKRNATAR